MAEAIRLYIGTNQGIFTTRPKGDGWEEPTPTLPDVFSRTIASSAERPERAYVAADKAGLFRTDDGGQRWTRILEGHVRCVTIDPTDDRVVYAGTEPVHLYRSEDRGETWEDLDSLLELPEEVKKNWWFPQPPHLGHVLHIFVHPDDPRLIYLSIEHGGIARSLDRGKTWEDVSGGIDYLDIHMVATLPHSFDRYYAATAQGFFATADPAQGWARSERGFTRDYFHDFIFLQPKREGEPPTMLISTADKSPGSWDRPEHARGAVFRSTDCGESWQRVGNGLREEMEENPWAICTHPYNADAAYIGLGRQRSPTSTTPGTVLLTRDRGDNWEPLDLSIPLVLSLMAAPE